MMNDFADVLTSMSSKFHEKTPDKIDINLNEDKTLKWRSLYNNQNALKLKKISADEGSAKIVNIQQQSIESCTENDEIHVKVESDGSSIDQQQDKLQADLSEKSDSSIKDINDQANLSSTSSVSQPLPTLGRPRGRKRQTENISKTASLRSLRIKDHFQLTDRRPERLSKDNSFDKITITSPSTSQTVPTTVDTGTEVKKETDTVEEETDDQSQSAIKPKLRRSERSHNVLSDNVTSIDPISEINDKTTDIVPTKSGKRGRKKKEPLLKEDTSMKEATPLKVEEMLLDQLPAELPDRSVDLATNVFDIESQIIKSEIKIETEKSIDVIGELKIPKKRGRKPGTKLKPKDDNFKTKVLTRRRRKLNSIPDKSQNVPPQQRLSRRIKPTAKILANDELRYGFELHNHARLSMSNEHLDKDPPENKEPSPSWPQPSESIDLTDVPIKTEPPFPEQLSSSHSTTSLNGISYQNQNLVKKVVFANESTISRPTPKPCKDPEEFLNEIKQAKINLHRSPENKINKMNTQQKRRLSRMKQNLFETLGLQKANKNDSSVDSNESDDNEEFVPSKKINVERSSVKLRERSHRDSTPNVEGAKLFVGEKKSDAKMIPQRASNSLILSTKHKRLIKSPYAIPASSPPPPATSTIVRGTNEVVMICLCRKPSKFYTEKSLETKYCNAVDEIDNQKVGCSKEIDECLMNLLRPSVRVSYMVLCSDHKRRLAAHNCCAGCGVFCTQGRFYLCEKNHFFHRGCANKFILNQPFSAINFTCPTLVLKCPHCGCDAPDIESTVTINCKTVPIFAPNQDALPTVARMSIGAYQSDSSFEWGGGSGSNNRRKCFIPEHVLNILDDARNSVPFSSQSGYTPKSLFYAMNNNDEKQVAKIIVSGFDITIPFSDFRCGSCLHLVANLGSTTMANLILSRAPPVQFLDLLDQDLRSAIMCSVVSGNNEILKLLMQHGANAMQKGLDGMTALHLSARLRNFAAAKIMCEDLRNRLSLSRFETFLNAIDDGGWTAIVWAAEKGDNAMVSYFISCGADTNVCDLENNSALHWAALSNSIETIRPLLQSNTNVNIQNIDADTPLHISCRKSNTSISLLLLAHGANLEVKNKSGKTPIDCIADKHSVCGKTLRFNREIRKFSNYAETNIACQDISNGRESYPIKVVWLEKRKLYNGFPDDLDELSIPDFKYITNTISLNNSIHIDRAISQMRSCSCSDNCTSQSCQCSEISVQNWYNAHGQLDIAFNFRDPAMIFECNDVCGCNKLLCKNRVVQFGIKVPLLVFECSEKAKGWGVKCLKNIVRGTFVAEYTGEILTSAEAARRTDDSYFFDLGSTEQFCIDANFYGNVSRFFNHSCEPNVAPVRVFFEHQDLRFPKIAFFATRDIESGEEITFDYGDKFWMVKCKSFTCHCGIPSCRFSNNKSVVNRSIDNYYYKHF